MEYKKDPDYGKEKCARCLLSPDREEAAIFIGMNKVISRALDSDRESVYPCKVLNRFVCPYDKKILAEGEDMARDNSQIEKSDVDYLFYLSELAFAVELALAKAQEEDSIFRIRSAADAYEALTNKEILEMVLQQGLKEEHKQQKDKIVEFLLNIKDRIRVEDLTFYLS
jgi:dsDNA-binding SOS-regulon protein